MGQQKRIEVFAKSFDFYDWDNNREEYRTEDFVDAVKDWIESNMEGLGDDAARKFVIENTPVIIYGFSHPEVNIDGMIDSAVDDIISGWRDMYGNPDDDISEREMSGDLRDALQKCVPEIIEQQTVWRLEEKGSRVLSSKEVFEIIGLESESVGG